MVKIAEKVLKRMNYAKMKDQRDKKKQISQEFTIGYSSLLSYFQLPV